MIQSKLDGTLTYKVNRDINQDDINKELMSYQINIMGIDVIISVGSEKYTHVRNNILYIPVYLIYDGEVISKIALYEFMIDDTIKIVDESGDYDLEKMDDPLIFPFITKEFLEKYEAIYESDEDSLGDIEEGDEEDKDGEENDEDGELKPFSDVVSVEDDDADEEDEQDDADEEDEQDEEDESVLDGLPGISNKGDIIEFDSEDSIYNKEQSKDIPGVINDDNDDISISSNESIDLIDTDSNEDSDSEEEDEEDPFFITKSIPSKTTTKVKTRDTGYEDNDDEDSDNIELEDEEGIIDTYNRDSSLISIQREHKPDNILPMTASIVNDLFEEDDYDYRETKDTMGTKDKYRGNKDYIDVVREKMDGETYKQSQKIKDKFIVSRPQDTNWLQSYFRNPHYELEDNEGGGDCLFAVIREAYKSIGKNISVLELRTILANEVTVEMFEQYRSLYLASKQEYKDTNKVLMSLKRENVRLKKALKTASNLSETKIIIDSGKKNSMKYNALTRENIQAMELLEEYRFMEGVNTVEDMKDIIKTCRFWAESWAISTLERVLNVKVIILSSRNYKEGDYNNIIQCGELNDSILGDRQVFKPKFYILTEWLGDHYKTILYKGKKILTFQQIPYDIKILIINKCLERNAGPYYIIPRFRELKENFDKIHIREDSIDYEEDNDDISPLIEGDLEEEEESEEDEMPGYIEELDDKISKLQLSPIQLTKSTSETPSKALIDTPSKSKSRTKEKTKSMSRLLTTPDNLYNPSIVFQYYQKSSNSQPGKGSGEKINPQDRKNFIKLSKHKDWRRKLSNLYISSFTLDNKQWSSIEHYVQAMRFKNVRPDIYDLFSLDSDSDLAKDSRMAKIVGETGKYKLERYFSSATRQDADYKDNRQYYMYNAMDAKFKNPELNEILRDTLNAKLQIYVPRNPAKVSSVLMKLRNNIFHASE